MRRRVQRLLNFTPTTWNKKRANVIIQVFINIETTFPCSSMVERVPVKDEVVGSNPTGGALRQAQCKHIRQVYAECIEGNPTGGAVWMENPRGVASYHPTGVKV